MVQKRSKTQRGAYTKYGRENGNFCEFCIRLVTQRSAEKLSHQPGLTALAVSSSTCALCSVLLISLRHGMPNWLFEMGDRETATYFETDHPEFAESIDHLDFIESIDIAMQPPTTMIEGHVRRFACSWSGKTTPAHGTAPSADVEWISPFTWNGDIVCMHHNKPSGKQMSVFFCIW